MSYVRCFLISSSFNVEEEEASIEMTRLEKQTSEWDINFMIPMARENELWILWGKIPGRSSPIEREAWEAFMTSVGVNVEEDYPSGSFTDAVEAIKEGRLTDLD